MHVIGTAGHIDHGKSTLIKALTGIHPDRLKEEKEREMTIDLGFAWMTLPNKEEVGIIDVPGHRDFIGNMLAGVGGIDAALFVIAADEGVMPQTREHLAILDLLQIKSGIIVLTKVDLIDEEEWIDLVEMDVRDVVSGTVLEEAPIVRVSAVTGEGLDLLVKELSTLLADVQKRMDLGRARLAVDRVFSITGFGTVVTGTLLDGVFRVGDEIEILPSEIKARIRGLQTHKTKEDFSVPGSRTAINISGIESSQVSRGDVIVAAKKYSSTQRFDAQVKVLQDVSAALKHNQEMKLFIGAKEVLARIRILGGDEILPGREGWIQIEPKEPVIVVRSDRFILRRPSPGETVGGGRVVNANPQKRHKRFSQKIIQQMQAYLHGTPEEIVFQAILDFEYCSLSEIQKKTRLENQVILDQIEVLMEKNLVKILIPSKRPGKQDEIYCSNNWLQELTARSLNVIELFHKQNPLKKGIPREELKSRLKVDQKIFLALVEIWQFENQIAIHEKFISTSGFKIVYSDEHHKKINSLFIAFDNNPYSPPGVKECINTLGPDLYHSLLESGALIEVFNDVVFRKEVYEQLLGSVVKEIQNTGMITVARFRDMFSTSRKYALGFLEFLDEMGITVREGDQRKLRDSFIKR